MLFILKNTTNGDLFYLIDKDIFFIGRKECDLLIQDDQSISRKHAKVFIKGGKAVITDLGSKYKTFCNDVELMPNKETKLNQNDELKFGIFNSEFRFEVHSLITTGTRLNSSLKEQVKKDIAVLGGVYSKNWHIGCTHLTVDEFILTIKVLQALIDKKPIVKPSYWSDLLKNARHNKNFPDVIKYMPPLAADLLNDIELRQDLDRTHVFDGKVFLFMKENNQKSLENVIHKAGGISRSWEKNPMSFKSILNSPNEILIMQTPDSEEDSNFVNIVQKLKENGKRPIPLDELALAVVLGNCEKNCNPNLKTDCHKKSTHGALVHNTQSERYRLGTKDFEGGNAVADTFDNSQQFNHSNIPSASQVANVSVAKDIARKTHCLEIKPEVDRNNGIKTQGMVQETVISKSTLKRKAQKDSEVAEKSRKRRNPFFILHKNNTKSTTFFNPHARMLKNSNVGEVNKEYPFNSTNQMEKETQNIRKLSCSSNIDMANTSQDKTSEYSGSYSNDVSSTWTNKKSISYSKDEPTDKKMQPFIDLFQGAVVVETIPKHALMRQKPPDEEVDNNSNPKNFKKFKKQYKMHPRDPHQIALVEFISDAMKKKVSNKKKIN